MPRNNIFAGFSNENEVITTLKCYFARPEEYRRNHIIVQLTDAGALIDGSLDILRTLFRAGILTQETYSMVISWPKNAWHNLRPLQNIVSSLFEAGMLTHENFLCAYSRQQEVTHEYDPIDWSLPNVLYLLSKNNLLTPETFDLAIKHWKYTLSNLSAYLSALDDKKMLNAPNILGLAQRDEALTHHNIALLQSIVSDLSKAGLLTQENLDAVRCKDIEAVELISDAVHALSKAKILTQHSFDEVTSMSNKAFAIMVSQFSDERRLTEDRYEILHQLYKSGKLSDYNALLVLNCRNPSALAQTVRELCQGERFTEESFTVACFDIAVKHIYLNIESQPTTDKAIEAVRVGKDKISSYQPPSEEKIKALCSLREVIIKKFSKKERNFLGNMTNTLDTKSYHEAMSHVKTALLQNLAFAKPGEVSKEQIELAKKVLGERTGSFFESFGTSFLSNPDFTKHEQFHLEKERNMAIKVTPMVS